jgi:hypothetical protein
VARKLLLTAATRHHAAALAHLLDLPNAAQHVDAETLAAMISNLLQNEDSIRRLCHLPAAAQLNEAAVAMLLRDAVFGTANASIHQRLCQLPGAQQMTCQGIKDLLLSCLQACTTPQQQQPQQHENWDILQHIVGLPAAQRLESSTVAQLLRTAVALNISIYMRARREMCIWRLCHLPGAAALGGHDIVELLQSAFRFSQTPKGQLQPTMDDAIFSLIGLPAARHLSTAELQQLMCAAVECSCLPGVAQICRLNSALQFTSEEILQPLQAAVNCSNAACTEELCRLPAAAQLSSAAVAELMQAATCFWCLRRLRWLPAAAQVSSVRVMQLLEAAVECKSSECVEQLCMLPAAQQLSSEQVGKILLAAVRDGREPCVEHVCMLPAARQVSKKQLEQALELSSERSGSGCDECVRQLMMHSQG